MEKNCDTQMKKNDTEIKKPKSKRKLKTKNLRKELSANNANEIFSNHIKTDNDKFPSLDETIDNSRTRNESLERDDPYRFKIKTEDEKKPELGDELNNNEAIIDEDNPLLEEGIEDFLVNGDFVFIKEEPNDGYSTKVMIKCDTDGSNFDIVKEEALDIVDEIKSENFVQSTIKRKSKQTNDTKPKMKRKYKKMDKSEDKKSNQSGNRYPCEHCGKTYSRKYHALRHMRNECKISLKLTPNGMRITKFQCKECDKFFTAKYSLKRHMEFIHKKNYGRVMCNICPKIYRDMDGLKLHWKKSLCGGSLKKKFNQFSCKKCHRSYRDNNSLIRHMRYECGVEPHLFCDHCDFATRQKINLSRHILRKHMDESTSVKCLNCSKIYKNESSLARHLSYECGKKPSFICDYCGHKSKRKFCIQEHIIKKHLKK